MKILLFGAQGQVGWELQRSLIPFGTIVTAGRHPDHHTYTLDLGDLKALKTLIEDLKPNLLVNAAAYTAVDKAESEPELAHLINGTVPGVMAEVAKAQAIPLIHYSTDYVFNGQGSEPYLETHNTDPLNVYGHSKRSGELAIEQVGGHYFIFRTSWVYGLRGKNFLLTILRLAQEKSELTIVDDQIGAPTWSRFIAEATAQILSQGLSSFSHFFEVHRGIYNLTAAGQTSWYQFAKTIVALDTNQANHHLQSIHPISTSSYPTPAKRPAYSVLSHQKLHHTFHLNCPDWEVLLPLAMHH